MGKRVRENTFLKFESVILTIILILWIIIISLNRLTYHNNKKGIIPLEKKLQDTELNIKDKNNKLDEINNNIKKYNNIENSINNTKKEYFNNIKKLEDALFDGHPIVSGSCINITLQELLKICPRKRRRKDAFQGLQKTLNKMGVTLNIKSQKG